LGSRTFLQRGSPTPTSLASATLFLSYGVLDYLRIGGKLSALPGAGKRGEIAEKRAVMWTLAQFWF
jgi:hypothetical protein